MNTVLATKVNSVLRGDVGVVAQCGDRSYFEDAGKSPTAPYNVLTEVASVAQETHGTDSDAEDTLDSVNVEIDCYGATPELALSLRSAVRVALLQPGVMPGVKVSGANQRQSWDDEVGLYDATIEFTLWYNPQDTE